MVIDELERGLDGPFGIVTLEGGFQVGPVDVLRPGEAAPLDHFAIALFVFSKMPIQGLCIVGILLYLMESDGLGRIAFVFDIDVVFAHESGGVTILPQHAADVHVVCFETNVKSGQALASFGEDPGVGGEGR